jgi:hypothetical protein
MGFDINLGFLPFLIQSGITPRISFEIVSFLPSVWVFSLVDPLVFPYPQFCAGFA